LIGLSFFSHTEGGLFIIAIFLVYLLIKKDYIYLIVALLSIIIIFYYIPSLIARPHGLIMNTSKNISFNFWEILRILVLWVNPISLVLIVKGIRRRLVSEYSNKTELTSSDVLLLAAITMSFLAVLWDTEGRSLLHAMTLLGLYGVYYFEKNTSSRLKIFYIIWQVAWLFVLLFGLVVSNTI
jgi:hypothetical protein